jgi:hypothetical protein
MRLILLLLLSALLLLHLLLLRILMLTHLRWRCRTAATIELIDVPRTRCLGECIIVKQETARPHVAVAVTAVVVIVAASAENIVAVTVVAAAAVVGPVYFVHTDCYSVTLTVDADTPMSAVGAAPAAFESDDGAVVCRSLLECWPRRQGLLGRDHWVDWAPRIPSREYMNVHSISPAQTYDSSGEPRAVRSDNGARGEEGEVPHCKGLLKLKTTAERSH